MNSYSQIQIRFNNVVSEQDYLQAAETGDVRAMMNLGSLYYRQGKYTDAVEILEKAVSINPNNASAFGNLSHYYFFTRDFKKSEEAAINGLLINSTQTWIKANLATALLLQGKYREAERMFLALKDEACFDNSTRTCAQAWLQDFSEFEKAGVIPENQKENVEKIRRLLRKK